MKTVKVDFPEMDKNKAKEIIDNLSKFHLNGLQFYDWQYKNGIARFKWGNSKELKFTKKKDSKGSYLAINVLELQYWDTIYIEK